MRGDRDLAALATELEACKAAGKDDRAGEIEDEIDRVTAALEVTTDIQERVDAASRRDDLEATPEGHQPPATVDDVATAASDDGATGTDRDALSVPDGSIDDILAWVGDDPARAQAALDAEESGKKRKGLLGHLGDLVAG